MSEYALPPLTESEIRNLEDEVYARLCGNHLTSDVAGWLAGLNSHLYRLNNRVMELEKLTAVKPNA